ncbi:MAG TPA: hypothetical protein VKF84_10545 [Candidatus Sulfotelmatobacter sp.]|nr:hypothetical protein [Candidatus Sulfotelmatobacter sp.]
MIFHRASALLILIGIVASTAGADTLELRNGSLIKGKFMGGTVNDINFQVGSSLQSYNLEDVHSLKFDADFGGSASDSSATPGATPVTYLTIPAGTSITVRTIDGIDSTKNHVGDRFQASLEEPITAQDGRILVPKGADVFGRLDESKESGTFTGRSQLQLELTGIVVNGQTVPLVTGEYELTGKSRGQSTAKRTIGGAAIGSIIGAIAGGGKGAAIGAGAGGGLGAGSEIVTKGDQVKIPSETLLDFTLQQSVSIPQRP